MTILLCLGTYLIYPLVIWLFGLLFPLKVDKKESTPFVSVIISAFNEARHIEEKIKNTLEVDYPEDKIEILVGSDGSQDHTALIMEKLTNKRVHFFNFPENRGKTAVQNDLVKRAKGDILVFTDAASFISPNAISEITTNFYDERVGCVAGCMHFLNPDRNLTTQSQGLYWRYESKIRELESKLGSLIGVDGPLYAIRPVCYIPLEHHVISDLITPLLVLEKGKKVVFEKDAKVYEEPTTRTVQEFSTRRRITLRGLIGLWSHRYLLNPLKYPLIAFQIVFHKLIRWSIGPLWLLNIASCLVMSDYPVFLFFFFLHSIFLILAIMGWTTSKTGKSNRFYTIPYYFCLVNMAATMAIIDFFRNKKSVSWNPVRE